MIADHVTRILREDAKLAIARTVASSMLLKYIEAPIGR